MSHLSRREWLAWGLAAAASPVLAAEPVPAAPRPADLHQQLLELAARDERHRRDRFAAVHTKAELESLQDSLRETFLRLLGGLPTDRDVPPAKTTGTIDADDYTIDKLVFESLPRYFVPALLYRPKKAASPTPAVISPCGHSDVGKAAATYQTLHVNLAKRGYSVLTYDPVGQGERSQFWDDQRKRSRYNLVCGEHAVLGNPLYLLGQSLARFRIWDGIRAIDYLASLPDVDAMRIGCVGNSGGGTLTAYIAALDPRVAVAAICCYITTLPRRMANRATADPDADPEQDIFGFVSEGIDHAGLLALRAPRPTLIGAARQDFFPIEGARESVAEAKKLFAAAGAADRVEIVESPEKHGLSLPLRTAVYQWFDRWLAGGKDGNPPAEIPVQPRRPADLLVCPDGQVNVSFNSRHLLPLAWEQFGDRKLQPMALKELLKTDSAGIDFRTSELIPLGKEGKTLIVCVNGNESADWKVEKQLLGSLRDRGWGAVAVDPRGVGPLRPAQFAGDKSYANPLAGAEENLAYNAFLVGRTLVAMRVADVLAAVRQLAGTLKPSRLVLCGRHDAAWVACLATVLEPGITHVALEGLPLSLRPLFTADATPINAASILPGLVRWFGDVPAVLDQIGPRKVLIAAGSGERPAPRQWLRITGEPLTTKPQAMLDWLDD